MKKVYMKPAMEIDYYTLDMSIASNCKEVVNSGPGDAALGYTQCSDFEDDFEVAGATTFAVYNVSFYEGGCDCYYSAGGEGYYMS